MHPVIPLTLVGSWYGYAAASDPDDTPYDRVFIRAGVAVVGTALGTWLTKTKSRLAVPLILASGVGTAAVGLIEQRRTGSAVRRTWNQDSWRERVFNKVMPVAHVGIAAAEVVDAALARVRHDASSAVAAAKSTALVDHACYPLARKLALYYMTFSLLGHWGEMLFCTGIKHGIFQGDYDRSNHMLWDQWLFPFPAEGTAVVLIALFLYPLKDKLLGCARRIVGGSMLPTASAVPIAFAASFLINQLVCTSIDYGTGMVANRNFELWDYRDMPYNFQGQICLQNSLLYTAVATWGVWWLFPRMERGLALAGDTFADRALVGLGSFFVFLELLYHVVPRDVAGFYSALKQAGSRMVGIPRDGEGAPGSHPRAGDTGSEAGLNPPEVGLDPLT